MATYIQFTTEEGGIVLVEAEEEEVSPRGGVSKAGLLDKLKKNVAEAETKLDNALQNAVKQNVRPFIKSAQDLAEEMQAVEMEVSFGLVMTGEIGNVAVGKAGAQSNYTVTLRWKQTGTGEASDGG